MLRFFNLRKDKRGAAAIEMSIALPTLLLMFYGIFQFSLALWANASLSNAVGQAARYATIYPTPTNAQIEAYARSEQLGLDPARLQSVTATRGVDSGRNFVDVQITYSTTLDFVFFQGPAITFQENRRAYLQAN